MTSYSILDNIEKKISTTLSKLLKTFENFMKNGVFAPEEKTLHFP